MAESINEPNKKLNLVGRLHRAITACKKVKHNIDKKNIKMLDAYASGYYKSEIHASDPHPLNLIDRAVSIWIPYLVGGYPKIIISPKINLALTPFANVFQMSLNQLLKEMKFDSRTLRPAVLNSLFSQGIVKTATDKAGTFKFKGYFAQYGIPFSEVVSDCNYIFDITAKTREQYEFEGDEYYIPTDEAKEEFSKFADKITPDFKLYGDKAPKEVTNPNRIAYNELKNYTRFIDLWLPKEKVIITILPPEKGVTKILRTVNYNGPVFGPYDVLTYKNFPESTIPIPPIYSLMELDAAINCLYSKARNQAERLKKVGVGATGNKEDLETARDCRDGDMLLLTNPDNVKELTLGGVVPEIYDFIAFSLNQYSEQGGNLYTTGGRKAQAKTLGQEELMMSNASRTLNDMAQSVHKFASSIAEKLAFELWNNPTMQIKTIRELPGGIQIPKLYNQLEQEGRFTDFYLDIQMYSMQKMSPEQKLQRMMQILTGWILPTAPMAAQQGQQLNVPAITKELSTYMDIETDSWFLTENPQNQQMNLMGSYQPMGQGNGQQQMSTKTKSSDQRFGASEADNQNNKLAQLNSQNKSQNEGY
ncbi:MAG: hypothetical protein PHH82_04570 [Candidatus ainarchaeum sp.]|nr:hypothetical protein [Candidatus ainarchaeum sp.]